MIQKNYNNLAIVVAALPVILCVVSSQDVNSDLNVLLCSSGKSKTEVLTLTPGYFQSWKIIE